MGENIGGAARAMWNFGLEHMRLVNPRDGWPNPKATAMASGAARVLDKVGVTETTADALSDMNFTFATTARSRDLTKPVMTPERAMEHARALIGQGQKVAVMFGPERSGLANDDIVQANALISVPVNPAFASLNLAQCVLLTAYEWRRQGDATPPEVVELAGTDFAETIEVQKLLERMETALHDVNFFWPEHKAESMILTLRNMMSRMPLTQADVRTFHGIIKALGKNKD
ncbi:tRNA (cytidine/uridine-2'-O-)-methyltransferase TrmJ [Amylibacter ulvae]|uniref:tRNA (Cytidine/uridine-2'-O-)-methyltransferase TrmJ n=2 Tax=Paramylibacter ulvae TaxID=1651968 RepID=A0ABQ3CWX3_9RHOB|nr:tRNA (cytidine/uridine-2'-O-)-methyltransferase TrmJ [Amylibacter ulvae]